MYTFWERNLIVVTKFTQHFLMEVYVFYKPKIYLQQYRIVGNCDWWLPWLHKAVGQSGREDSFLTHFRVLRGYRFFLIDAYLCLPRLIVQRYKFQTRTIVSYLWTTAEFSKVDSGCFSTLKKLTILGRLSLLWLVISLLQVLLSWSVPVNRTAPENN